MDPFRTFKTSQKGRDRDISISFWTGFKKNELAPHKNEYWLFPKIEDQQEFVARIEKISAAYNEAKLESSTINVSSSDEKTGIQALVHIKKEAGKPGQRERKDPEYERNGTLSLIASTNVRTGKLNAYSLGGTRTEKDYVRHIEEIVSTSPDGEHVIICYQLNTHKSATLVEWVAKQIGFKEDLGIKGKKGILRDMDSRMQFLEAQGHRIRFLYTPKHCSWLNQIENWFSKLERQVLKRGEFSSTEVLETRIEKYIIYYNICMAKPMNWESNGEKYRRKLMN